MRIVNIYDASGSLISSGYIQINDASVSRNLNSKIFTMADGSITMYTAASDKNQMTLSLECNEAQANAFENAAHMGKFLFSGMRAGSDTCDDQTAFVGYITGACKIRRIAPDLYALDIPLQIAGKESLP